MIINAIKKKKLLVSMSGGRTSAYMAKFILDNYSNKYNVKIVFANTGQERNETLDFIQKCDEHFGFNTIWVEAEVIYNERKSSSFKIVNYETASREGKPFEDVIKKYGLPNPSYLHCTRELKENPIHAYIKSIGWKKGEYYTALGIRADEPKRLKRNKTKQNKVYPLADWISVDKLEILDWWEKQSFNLELLDHQGNCKWCFKKSHKKLLSLAIEDKANFDFPIYAEKKYGLTGGNKVKGIQVSSPRILYRGYKTAEMILNEALLLKNTRFNFDEEDNEGCGSSCEPFMD